MACGFIYYLEKGLKTEFLECVDLIENNNPKELAQLIKNNAAVRRKLGQFTSTVQQLQTMQRKSSAITNGIYGNPARMGMDAKSINSNIYDIESTSDLLCTLEENTHEFSGLYIATEHHAYSVVKTIDKHNESHWHVMDANAERESFSHSFNSKKDGASYLFKRIKYNAGMELAIILRDDIPFKETAQKILNFMQNLSKQFGILLLPDFFRKSAKFSPVIATGILMTKTAGQQNALSSTEPAMQDITMRSHPRAELSHAILTHNISWVRKILTNNPDLDLTKPCHQNNRSGYFYKNFATPMIHAIWSQNIVMVDELLHRKVKVTLDEVRTAIEMRQDEMSLILIDHITDHAQLIKLLPYAAYHGLAEVSKKIMMLSNVKDVDRNLGKLINKSYRKKKDRMDVRNFIQEQLKSPSSYTPRIV